MPLSPANTQEMSEDDGEHNHLVALEVLLSDQRSQEAAKHTADEGVGSRAVHDANVEASRIAREGDYNGARELLRRAYQLTKQPSYAQFFPGGRAQCLRLRAMTLNNFGCTAKRAGQGEAALTALRNALAIEEDVASVKEQAPS